MLPVLTITVLILLGIIWGIRSIAHRRRMSRALGHKVSKLEVNSLSGWMQATDAEEEHRR